MNKRIISLLLSAVFLLGMLVTAVPAFAAPDDSGIRVSADTVSPGDTFTVTLKIPGTDRTISDLQTCVEFQKSVFEVTAYEIPNIAGMTKMQSNVKESNAAGEITSTYLSDSSEADVAFVDGIEFTATFKVKENAEAKDYAFTVTIATVNSLTEYGLPDELLTCEDLTRKSATVKVKDGGGASVDSGIRISGGYGIPRRYLHRHFENPRNGSDDLRSPNLCGISKVCL